VNPVLTDGNPAVNISSVSAPGRTLALAGPTASGKTAAALAIAARYDAEIISVDSALVYRGMDIGTAKPSAAERAAVPHHLIDIRDPLQPYSAAEFAVDAQRLIGEIHARGKLALLTGGTMLYFKALFEGLDPMPRADAALRAEIEAQARHEGWPAMHANLARVDPETAARLAPADSQRIQRALEVYRASGRPLSSFFVDKATRLARTRAPALISLEPEERGWLHKRIAERFDTMLATGLLDEVRTLRARGDLHADLPSMRCVGYRQAWEILDRSHDQPGAADLRDLRDLGIYATRQLAKRQITWLRGMPARHIVAADAPDTTAQVMRRTQELLA
jgi:tRNA dimethylallyltransferase